MIAEITTPRLRGDAAGNLIGDNQGFSARYTHTQHPITQHQHVSQLGLIHMNGRAYDPGLGRFLGVDPFIQFPTNSQSLNPYSYILNNPLSGTDPTGYAACMGGSDEWKTGGCAMSIEKGRSGSVTVDGGADMQLNDSRTAGFNANGRAADAANRFTNGAQSSGKVTVGTPMPVNDIGASSERSNEAQGSNGWKITKQFIEPLSQVPNLGQGLAMFIATVEDGSGAKAHLFAQVKIDAQGQPYTINSITGERQSMGEGRWAVGMTAITFIPEVGQVARGGKGALQQATNSIKTMRGADSIVVIGETMARVEAAAAKIPGAKTLNDMPDFSSMGYSSDQVTSLMMRYNRKWILEQLRSGRTILDIGKDPSRKTPSIFYQMEQNMIKNYQRLHNEWDAVVK